MAYDASAPCVLSTPPPPLSPHTAGSTQRATHPELLARLPVVGLHRQDLPEVSCCCIELILVDARCAAPQQRLDSVCSSQVGHRQRCAAVELSSLKAACVVGVWWAWWAWCVPVQERYAQAGAA
jgi:hypothetical protein